MNIPDAELRQEPDIPEGEEPHTFLDLEGFTGLKCSFCGLLRHSFLGYWGNTVLLRCEHCGSFSTLVFHGNTAKQQTREVKNYVG